MPHPSLQHFLTVDDAQLSLHGLPASSPLPLSALLTLPPSCLRWYTKFHVKSMLSLMGVKPRHTHRIIHAAYASFHLLSSSLHPSPSSTVVVPLLLGPTPFPSHCTLALPSSLFLSVLQSALAVSKHFHPSHSPRLLLFAHALITRQRCVVILLAGASGTGKSTLASLLADRLRIDRVIGTDGVRHVLRGRVPRDHCPVLHLSTYRAWECVRDTADPAVLTEEYRQGAAEEEREREDGGEGLSHAMKVRLGYHRQSLLICSHLHSLVASLVASRTSAIIEGVHLLPSFLSYLLAHASPHSVLLPFLVYISNETKHRERFAVRSLSSPSPTLSPSLNPYVAAFPAIRGIQKHLVQQCAERWPSIDNTNVDRSVAAVHEIALHVMARGGEGGAGEEVVREVEGMRREAWGGKAMQRVLRMKVEKRHLFERLREAERERRERDEDGDGEGERREGEEEDGDAGETIKDWHLSEKLERLFPSSAGAASQPSSSVDPSRPSSVSPPQATNRGQVKRGDQAGGPAKSARSSSSAAAPPSPSLSPASALRGRGSLLEQRSGQVHHAPQSPSSPLLSSSLTQPPSFLQHLPHPHLVRRSSSPPLPSPETSSVMFAVSDDDGPGGAGGRSESEEGGGSSTAWSMGGGSLKATSVDEDETGEEEDEEDGGEGKAIEVIPESEDEDEAGRELDVGVATSDSESAMHSRARLDTDEEEDGHQQQLTEAVRAEVVDGQHRKPRRVVLY